MTDEIAELKHRVDTIFEFLGGGEIIVEMSRITDTKSAMKIVGWSRINEPNSEVQNND
jgi:hypothetical protein